MDGTLSATETECMSDIGHLWWHHGVVYQIYPRSFQDTTGNGIGDLRGVTKRLPYLADVLGVDAIWLSPFFRSPMADFGYDVADYVDVDPLFGTLADFDALVAEAHRVGLKVVIDWVPNHSSDRHHWFIESSSSRDNPKRDWYIWRKPGEDGSLPNNWVSLFGGPAWTFHEPTGEYYLHSFLREQPDLNWRNPEVVDAMHDTIRFWMDRGVDGFRLDVIHMIMKDPDLRDNPPSSSRPGWFAVEYDAFEHLHDKAHPDIHEQYRRLRRLVDDHDPSVERMLVGEIEPLPWAEWVEFYGAEGDGLHLPFNFRLIETSWDARAIKAVVDELEAALPSFAWPNYVLGNHDQTRLASRVGDEQVRVAAMLLLTLRGTPTMYYGDEIGMQQADIPPERQQDPFGRRVPGEGRDGCRTPMQWDATPGAGFSTADASDFWLPLSEDFTQRNVATQIDDPESLLTLYRTLLRLRRDEPALNRGIYRPLDGPPDVFVFERSHESTELRVALNLGSDRVSVALSGTVLAATASEHREKVLTGSTQLGPGEGIVVRVR